MPQSAIYYLLCIAMFFLCVYCISEHDVFLESCFNRFKEGFKKFLSRKKKEPTITIYGKCTVNSRDLITLLEREKAKQERVNKKNILITFPPIKRDW